MRHRLPLHKKMQQDGNRGNSHPTEQQNIQERKAHRVNSTCEKIACLLRLVADD